MARCDGEDDLAAEPSWLGSGADAAFALLRQEQAYAGVIMSISDQSDLERTLPDGSPQLTGYRIDAATAQGIRAIELDPRAVAQAASARVLLLDRDGPSRRPAARAGLPRGGRRGRDPRDERLGRVHLSGGREAARAAGEHRADDRVA